MGQAKKFEGHTEAVFRRQFPSLPPHSYEMGTLPKVRIP